MGVNYLETEVPYSAVQKGRPDKPINIRLEFARGSLRSLLLAQQTLRAANMREPDDERSNYELECADARIEDLEVKLLLPDEDVLLTSLRPGETTEIEKEIELSTLRIRQGEMTLSEIDELWRRIELLRKVTENSLDKQITELAVETNKFHDMAEEAEKGVVVADTEESIKVDVSSLPSSPNPAMMPEKLRTDFGTKLDAALPDINDDYERALCVARKVRDEPSRDELPKFEVPDLEEVRALVEETGKTNISILEMVWKIFGAKSIHPDSFWELKKLYIS